MWLAACRPGRAGGPGAAPAHGRGPGPRADRRPCAQDVVDTHPGLAFLKEAADFHSRYITTVSTSPAASQAPGAGRPPACGEGPVCSPAPTRDAGPRSGGRVGPALSRLRTPSGPRCTPDITLVWGGREGHMPRPCPLPGTRPEGLPGAAHLRDALALGEHTAGPRVTGSPSIVRWALTRTQRRQGRALPRAPQSEHSRGHGSHSCP